MLLCEANSADVKLEIPVVPQNFIIVHSYVIVDRQNLIIKIYC